MAAKTKTPPTARKSREEMPLRIQRSGIISRRVRRVFWIVQSMRDKPYTRNKFSSDLENLLHDAVHEFCRWLYAEANGRRKEARRCWDDVQQMVEYELPLVILYAKRACKTRRGREKVINGALPLVLTKAIPKAKLCEDLAYKNSEPASPRRRVKRPDKNRFGEFCPWVKVITETLTTRKWLMHTTREKLSTRDARAVLARQKQGSICGKTAQQGLSVQSEAWVGRKCEDTSLSTRSKQMPKQTSNQPAKQKPVHEIRLGQIKRPSGRTRPRTGRGTTSPSVGCTRMATSGSRLPVRP